MLTPGPGLTCLSVCAPMLGLVCVSVLGPRPGLACLSLSLPLPQVLPVDDDYAPALELKVIDYRDFGYQPVVGQSCLRDLRPFLCQPQPGGLHLHLPPRGNPPTCKCPSLPICSPPIPLTLCSSHHTGKSKGWIAKVSASAPHHGDPKAPSLGEPNKPHHWLLWGPAGNEGATPLLRGLLISWSDASSPPPPATGAEPCGQADVGSLGVEARAGGQSSWRATGMMGTGP